MIGEVDKNGRVSHMQMSSQPTTRLSNAVVAGQSQPASDKLNCELRSSASPKKDPHMIRI